MEKNEEIIEWVRESKNSLRDHIFWDIWNSNVCFGVLLALNFTMLMKYIILYVYLAIVTKFSKEIRTLYIDSCGFFFKCICYHFSNETLVYHIFTYIFSISFFSLTSDNDVVTIITYILWISRIFFFPLNNVTVSITLPHIYLFLWAILLLQCTVYKIYNCFDIITKSNWKNQKSQFFIKRCYIRSPKFWSPPDLLLNLITYQIIPEISRQYQCSNSRERKWSTGISRVDINPASGRLIVPDSQWVSVSRANDKTNNLSRSASGTHPSPSQPRKSCNFHEE